MGQFARTFSTSQEFLPFLRPQSSGDIQYFLVFISLRKKHIGFVSKTLFFPSLRTAGTNCHTLDYSSLTSYDQWVAALTDIQVESYTLKDGRNVIDYCYCYLSKNNNGQHLLNREILCCMLIMPYVRVVFPFLVSQSLAHDHLWFLDDFREMLTFPSLSNPVLR